MSMDLIQLYPWGDAELTHVDTKTLTFRGQDYIYRKYELGPAPIIASRVQRLSQTELQVLIQPDPSPDDTTDPTLSSPSGSATGANTADGSVDTDEADGVLYHITTTNSTAPSSTQIKNGNQADGSGAAHSGSKLVGSTGTHGITADGLTSSTTYYHHFMHEDEASNQSSVATSSSFTTS